MRRGAVWGHGLLLAGWVILGGAGAARGDTIVLKNGRRIVAYNVSEDNGHISYETPAGKLSLPKSIVDHVERDGAVPAGYGASASSLGMTAPAVESSVPYNEIARAAVHDGSIDRGYIGKVEDAARGGDRAASERAAVARHVAAQFELSRGNLEQALVEERRALTYAPDQPGLLLNVAYLHLRRSEYKRALEYLDRARRLTPDSPDVAKLAGWAYYGMNKLDQAVAEWKRALSLHADSEVLAALDKAERDKEAEDTFAENESSHFTLRYHGAAAPTLARDVLRALEYHFSSIQSELNFSPPAPIGVVLYTQEAFADITRAPGWVGALNDGRIRVPVQGLSSVPPELSRILKHELTHSFVQQKTHGRCPVWLQEGLAQWMEGRRSGENAAVLLQIYDEKRAAPLGTLEGSWMSLPPDAAAYAYAWALASVESIVQSGGMSDIERILDRLTTTGSTEEALREVLHVSYEDLAQSAAEYLRRSYGR